MKKNVQQIEIVDFKKAVVSFKIVGVTPLIMNKFSQKSLNMILEKQMKKAGKGKEAKNPEELFKESIHWFNDGIRIGFPVSGFKEGMVRASKQLGMIMIDTRGKFHILADEGDLVEIQSNPPKFRQDHVKIGMGTTDVRIRAEFEAGWTTTLKIVYYENSISIEQLAQLINIAGFSSGIGEWRPERGSGSFGLYEIATL